MVIDDLTDGTKFVNLVDLTIADYMDKDEFQARIVSGDEFEEWDGIEVIFHEGACSATTEWNGKFIMEVNYEYSKDLFHYCIERRSRSSTPLPPRPMAGATTTSSKTPGSSSLSTSTATPKQLFDRYVRRWMPEIGSPGGGSEVLQRLWSARAAQGSMASAAFHPQQPGKQGTTPAVRGLRRLPGRWPDA